ncbi:MAG: type II secretion system protein GspG [Labilithrix sp.]|nr:type II secretion system protein GspG [Labilithrix sp.]
MISRRGESRVFFPWERRRGLFGVLGRARVRLVAAAIVGLVVIVWIRAREERAAGVRATRATITQAYFAVSAYRADHAGACPKELGELVTGGYAQEAPIDAWGRPLRLTCPGRRDPQGFDLVSDGPDGEPFGLDRVE